MKLYTLDMEWEGGFAVIANNKEEALRLMEKCYGEITYYHKARIQENNIENGFVKYFLGDT